MTAHHGVWGQVEVPVTQIEPDATNATDANGNPLKAYSDPFRAWSVYNGGGGGKDIRGLTATITKRPPGERQAPAGYGGSGNVTIRLKPNFKYFRINAGTGSEE